MCSDCRETGLNTEKLLYSVPVFLQYAHSAAHQDTVQLIFSMLYPLFVNSSFTLSR